MTIQGQATDRPTGLEASPSDPFAVWPALKALVARQHLSGRDAAIDVGRLIGIAAVVAIHTVDASHYPGAADGGRSMVDAGQVIDQLARFAVPFFFIASGYFTAGKDLTRPGRALRDVVVRIAFPYLAWTLAFNLTSPAALAAARHDPFGFLVRTVLQGGTAPHLWFLPSLVLCLAIAIVGLRVLTPRMLLALGVLLYIAGLAIGSDAFLVFGRPASAMQMHLARDAPSFGLVFVAAGAALRRSGWRPGMAAALATFALGAALHLGEGLALAHIGLHPLADNDYLAGTLPFGIGAFMIALAWPERFPLPAALAALGTCSLGLYALHPVFVIALAPLLHEPLPLATRLAIWAGSLLGSIVIAVEMTRWRGTRWLVR